MCVCVCVCLIILLLINTFLWVWVLPTEGNKTKPNLTLYSIYIVSFLCTKSFFFSSCEWACVREYIFFLNWKLHTQITNLFFWAFSWGSEKCFKTFILNWLRLFLWWELIEAYSFFLQLTDYSRILN